MTEPVIRPAGPEDAAAVHAVVAAAFSARPVLDPPADALAETVESLQVRLSLGGGLLATGADGTPLGAVLLDPVGSTLFLRRFGVLPAAQGQGVAHRLVEVAAGVARERGLVELAVVAREELPRSLRFWRRQGFAETGSTPPYVELRRPAATRVREVPDAEAMRAVGRDLAAHLGAGDLLVLTGELGAGKTTLTQGLGEGLGVRGGVTSPTFVIARVHPSTVGGPDLVHVDAYRLGGRLELDDLDLDASTEESVTVVEWGEGLAEGLAASRLEVRIVRDADAPAEGDLDPRRVEVTAVGPRWEGVDLLGTALPGGVAGSPR